MISLLFLKHRGEGCEVCMFSVYIVLMKYLKLLLSINNLSSQIFWRKKVFSKRRGGGGFKKIYNSLVFSCSDISRSANTFHYTISYLKSTLSFHELNKANILGYIKNSYNILLAFLEALLMEIS